MFYEKIKFCDKFLVLFLKKVVLEVIDFYLVLNFYGEII